MQIVFAQNEAQRLNGEEISAAGIAQNMPPPSRVLDLVAATSGNGGAASSIHNNPITMPKRGSDAGITIASGSDLRARPDLRAKIQE